MSDDATTNSGLGPVSVVVVNYQGERYLEGCLAAVRALEGDVGEVIVVDNASTDRSLEIVRARFPEARVIPMPSNQGPCPARNAGLRAARHRWVLALDNDALVRPDVLVKLAGAARARPDAAIVQPRSVFATEPSRVHYDGGSFHYAGLIALRNFYTPVEAAIGTGVVDVDCAVAVALLVDRDAILAAGGYDETMFILFEDLDLSYRLRALGRAILSVEDALVLHQGGTPGISFREGPSYPGARIFFHSRNRWTYLLKCHSAGALVAAAPGLALYEAVWFLFCALQGGVVPWLRGKLAFVGLLGHVARTRRAVQAARVIGDRTLLAGGPLTITPALAAGGTKRALLRALDRCLALWWSCARRLLPRG